jgi:8-oxo-dGTP pyrophosphatase MutT (NUDIX family)
MTVPTARDALVSGRSSLSVNDAVAAIIRIDADGYLMQLRDSRPDIWYPGHWGLFGGGVEPGEDPIEALKRELYEELELEFRSEDAQFFARIDFDLGGLGLPRYYRSYYLVPVTLAVEEQLVLHEGAARRVFSAVDILREPHVTPYDAFALFLHHARGRLADPA